MARQATSMKKTRTRCSQAYKDEALALADRVGASAVAREQALAEENARLKRQLAENSEEFESAKKLGCTSRRACIARPYTSC